jgi:carbonic anhydrase
MPETKKLAETLPRDLVAGLIVFLVALPLCLGIALASGAPLFSGLIAGIVGGMVAGSLSGSQTSVSGPGAGLTAVVAAQIGSLGSFETFLLAVLIAGIIQVILGCAKAGALSAFFPSSVIKGLLAAIGVILIIKQTPYLLGYDMVPKTASHGHSNILAQIAKIFTGEIHWGALVIGCWQHRLWLAWRITDYQCCYSWLCQRECWFTYEIFGNLAWRAFILLCSVDSGLFE